MGRNRKLAVQQLGPADYLLDVPPSYSKLPLSGPQFYVESVVLKLYLDLWVNLPDLWVNYWRTALVSRLLRSLSRHPALTVDYCPRRLCVAFARLLLSYWLASLFPWRYLPPWFPVLSLPGSTGLRGGVRSSNGIHLELSVLNSMSVDVPFLWLHVLQANCMFLR